jgi:hypothetical protein
VTDGTPDALAGSEEWAIWTAPAMVAAVAIGDGVTIGKGDRLASRLLSYRRGLQRPLIRVLPDN